MERLSPSGRWSHNEAAVSVRKLRQSVEIKASPHEVFESLVDPRQHAKFSGATAKLERRIGGRFTHYDGSPEGVVVDLKKDSRIVLAWRSTGWPEGHYSIAQFELTPSKGGTRLVFSQFGIPSDDFEDIRDGWKQYYWGPLKAYREA
jgi:activator of HSP90 ATPase